MAWAGASTPVSTAAGTRGLDAMLKKFAHLTGPARRPGASDP